MISELKSEFEGTQHVNIWSESCRQKRPSKEWLWNENELNVLKRQRGMQQGKMEWTQGSTRRWNQRSGQAQIMPGHPALRESVHRQTVEGESILLAMKRSLTLMHRCWSVVWYKCGNRKCKQRSPEKDADAHQGMTVAWTRWETWDKEMDLLFVGTESRSSWEREERKEGEGTCILMAKLRA